MHVNQNNHCNDEYSPSGADIRMTMLPAKLKSVGWDTAMVGKWHCGARSHANLPTSRGFDIHLGFLKGGEDHWTQRLGCTGRGSCVDLWEGQVTPGGGGTSYNHPAKELNGTYSGYLYGHKATKVIDDFAAKAKTKPQAKLFFYLPWHNTHDPLEAPPVYEYPAHFTDAYQPRMTYNAMARALDEGMGNVTSAIRSGGLWDSSLIVWSADNGGWLRRTGSSNWPLRGGKVSDFEGGVRAVSFMAGGFLPPDLAGTRYAGIIAVADWYATFCGLAGVEPSDPQANKTVPAVDSLDMWPSLRIPNNSISPRTTVFLSYQAPGSAYGAGKAAGQQEAGLIVGDAKVVCGIQGMQSFWQSTVYPNASSGQMDPTATAADIALYGCGWFNESDALASTCCLFNLTADPTEHHDLRQTEPALFASLMTELEKQRHTVYQTDFVEPDTHACMDANQLRAYYGNFLGPPCAKTLPPGLPPPAPPAPAPAPPVGPAFAMKRGGLCLAPGGTAPAGRAFLTVVAAPCTDASKHWTYFPLPASASSASSSTEAELWGADGPGGTTIRGEGDGKGARAVVQVIAHVQPSLYIKLDEHRGAGAGNGTIAGFCQRGRVYLNAAMDQRDQAAAAAAASRDYSVTQQGFTFDAERGSFESTACDTASKHCMLVPASGAAASLGSCSEPSATGWSIEY